MSPDHYHRSFRNAYGRRRFKNAPGLAVATKAMENEAESGRRPRTILSEDRSARPLPERSFDGICQQKNNPFACRNFKVRLRSIVMPSELLPALPSAPTQLTLWPFQSSALNVNVLQGCFMVAVFPANRKFSQTASRTAEPASKFRFSLQVSPRKTSRTTFICCPALVSDIPGCSRSKCYRFCYRSVVLRGFADRKLLI